MTSAVGASSPAARGGARDPSLYSSRGNDPTQVGAPPREPGEVPPLGPGAGATQESKVCVLEKASVVPDT